MRDKQVAILSCILLIFLMIEFYTLLNYQKFFFMLETVEAMSRANYFAGNMQNFFRGFPGRSIFYPILLSLPDFIFSSLTGIMRGISIVVFMRFVSVFFATLSVYLTFLLGKKAGNWKVGVVAAALLVSTFPFLYFSLYPREDILATTFILLVYVVYLSSIKDKKNNIIVGFLMGLTILLRYASILFFIPVIFDLLKRRGIKSTLQTILAFITIFFVFQGVIDYIFFEDILHAPKEYVIVNFIIGHAFIQSIKEVNFYLKSITETLGFMIFFLMVGIYSIIKNKKNVISLAVFIIVLSFFSYIPNKDLRFIYPLFPFVSILIAFGLDYKFPWFGKLDSKIVAILILVFFILNLKSNYHNFELKSGYVSAFEYLNDEISKGNLRKKHVVVPEPWRIGYNLLNKHQMTIFGTMDDLLSVEFLDLTSKVVLIKNSGKWKNITLNSMKSRYETENMKRMCDINISSFVLLNKIWINIDNNSLYFDVSSTNDSEEIKYPKSISCKIGNITGSIIKCLNVRSIHANNKKKSNVSITIQYYDSNDIMGCLLCGRNLSAYAITNSLGPFKCDDAKLIKSFDDVGEGKVYLYEFGDNER